MYSTLMVQLELDKDNATLLDMAGDLAERFDANVTGIVACQALSLVATDGVILGDVIDRDCDEKIARMSALEKTFRTALQHRSRGLEWHSKLTTGAPTGYIVEQMLSADLLITAIDHPGSWLDTTWHVDTADLIMRVGRPVLVVPERARHLAANKILVGWKDTRESRRAISDALPFLRTAKSVVVVSVVVDPDGIPAGRADAQLACDWLKRHGIDAEPLALTADDTYAAPLNTIALQQGADLVVAGAYGHSRLHEWVLGGVTRELLEHADVCSLLSH